MPDFHFNPKLLLQVLRKAVGGEYAAMLSACASKADHQAFKISLQIIVHADVHQAVYVLKEDGHLGLIHQEFLYFLISAR